MTLFSYAPRLPVLCPLFWILYFSSISYYKPINLSLFPLQTQIHKKLSLSAFSFQWSDQCIALSPIQTIELNMKDLFSQFESEIKRLSQFPTSWITRINLVKILLPEFIYLTRTIPYIIPMHCLSKLQALLLKVIWNNFKPRFRKHLLFLLVKLGGLWVPNLASYNIAVIPEPAYILWHHLAAYRWSQLEDDFLPLGFVRGLMALSLF